MEITAPDDWHLHIRDGEKLKALSKAPNIYSRAIIMPNLVPPITTTAQALEYRKRIIDAGFTLEPLMTLYLTDKTPPEEIYKARDSGYVFAVKLYPAGATTNSDSGVTNIEKVYPTLKAMSEVKMPLLVHGEVTDSSVDVFDKEKIFIDRHLIPLRKAIPELKIVMEHITTKEAAEYVAATDNMGATITCHHLLYNRNEIFKGGIRPHMYCLPILKREVHRLALLEAIKNKKFFLGTDSAPHAVTAKECSHGCAGCYTAPFSLELYAEAFQSVGALEEHFENFTSFNGPDFYGLPRNTAKIKLSKNETKIPQSYDFGEGSVVKPLRAGETLQWRAERI